MMIRQSHPRTAPRLAARLLPRAACALLTAFLAACGTATAPMPDRAESVEAGPRTETVEAPMNADAAAVTQALQRARSGELPFRLITHCAQPDSGIRNVTVYPAGVAVWNGGTQINVPQAARGDLAEILLNRDFAQLQAAYGGKPPRPSEPEVGAPLTINCRITFEAGGVAKTSVQQIYGDQSAEMIGLAQALLDRLEPLANDGVTADDLEDGLSKLASGVLAPEMLELRLVALPANDEATGFILRAEDATVLRRPYAPGRELGDADPQPMDPETWTRLMTTLQAADFPSLPRNLHSDDQLELEVRVLGHHHTVLARSFSGMDRSKNADAQQRFDRLVKMLRSLGLS